MRFKFRLFYKKKTYEIMWKDMIHFMQFQTTQNAIAEQKKDIHVHTYIYILDI